jgi:N-acetyl-anhydromuramyl-L-alanine amidase AmpD|nr:MAG TPA: endodeoxyribonuclease I [Caudoviricetes sp.]
MLNIIEKTYKINGNLSTRNSTERIILHHAAASQCSADDIDKWHKQKDYSCIGYHFFIRKDGTIYRGRQENAVGAHAYQNNYNSIGICFEGDFEKEQMTDTQVEAGKELVAYLKNKYNISKVQKHSDVCSTSCPGRNFKFDEIANSTVKNVNTSVEVKKEARGNVATIQSTLNSRYGLNVAVDNIYGKETKKALVKALQTELNRQYTKSLTIDGIFGNLTKNACISLKKGAKGNMTWTLQAMLVCKGYSIEVDSDFGINTENAVKDFQSKNRLVVDGIARKKYFCKIIFIKIELE